MQFFTPPPQYELTGWLLRPIMLAVVALLTLVVISVSPDSVSAGVTESVSVGATADLTFAGATTEEESAHSCTLPVYAVGLHSFCPPVSQPWWAAVVGALGAITPVGWVIVGGLTIAVVIMAMDGHDGDVDEAWQRALDSCTEAGGVPTNISVGSGDWTFDCEGGAS